MVPILRPCDANGTLTMILVSLVLPTLVALFMIAGYFVGEQHGDWYGLLGTLIGGILGFILGAIGFLHLLERLGRPSP